MLRKYSAKLREERKLKERLEIIKKKPLPDNFYRGFSSPECFTGFGYVGAGAFQFLPNTEEPRTDCFNEASINWDDEPQALTTLLSQVNSRTGEKQFKYGYVKIPMSDLLPRVREHMRNGHFDFERRPLVNNIYHGNLLLHSSFKKAELKTFQDGLAMIANTYYRREE